MYLTEKAGGNPVPNPIQRDGKCVDSNGRELLAPTDARSVFPQGFSQVFLIQGFSATSTRQRNLLGSIQNSPELVFEAKSLTIPITGFESDYYSLVLVAFDSNGAQVRGSSRPIGILGSGPLPPASRIVF
jgi:hypothetical protein